MCSMFILLLSATCRPFAAVKYSQVTALGTCSIWVLSLYWGQFSVLGLKSSSIMSCTDRKPRTQNVWSNGCSNTSLHWTVRDILLSSLTLQNWGISCKLFVDQKGPMQSPEQGGLGDGLLEHSLGRLAAQQGYSWWSNSADHKGTSADHKGIQDWSQRVLNAQVEM